MNADYELQTVPGYFYRTCGEFPSRPAQRFNASLYRGDNNGRFTYDEMLERVECIACGLMSLGLEKQDRVGLMSRTSPYWTQADMAIAACAGVSVAVSPMLSPVEASRILGDAACRFVLVDDRENFEKILGQRENLPRLEKIVVMDFSFQGGGEGIIGLWELMSTGRQWRKKNEGLFRERRESVTPGDWFTILYASGATGKGVILTHGSVSFRIEGFKRFFSSSGMAITKDDVALCHLPLSQIFERGSCELLAICQGACIAYADNPESLLQDMQKYNPTWINCVPWLSEKISAAVSGKMAGSPFRKWMFDLAVHAGRRALDYRRDHRGCYNMSPDYELELRLPPMLRIQYRLADRLFRKVRALFGKRFRFAFSTSSGISPDLLRLFYTLGLAVVEGYGSTETASACLLNPLTACKPGYLGVEACGSRVRVAPDGELEISGAGLFSGYLNLPGDTREAFTEDGWFRTGDLVQTDDYGNFRRVGRKQTLAGNSPDDAEQMNA